jgi:hypothetical protein
MDREQPETVQIAGRFLLSVPMDNCPPALTPFDGPLAIPFSQWWPRVCRNFPGVPENVGEQWLHRHWGRSPYRWLRLREYQYTPLASDRAEGTYEPVPG